MWTWGVTDFRCIVAPVKCLIYVVKDEILKSFVIGSTFRELVERVRSVREQFSHCIADEFGDAPVVAMGKLLVEFVNRIPSLDVVSLRFSLHRFCSSTRFSWQRQPPYSRYR